MNQQTAKSILESHGVIEVLYQGSPVWIEQVLDSDHARVTDLQSDHQLDVALTDLNEGEHHL